MCTDPVICVYFRSRYHSMCTDPEVFRDGHFLLNLGEIDKPLVEQLLAKMRTPTLLLDWHFCGGRCYVLYLGNHAEAVARFAEFASWYSEENYRIMSAKYPELYSDGFCRRYEWTVADCAEAGMVSIGQVWNRIPK